MTLMDRGISVGHPGAGAPHPGTAIGQTFEIRWSSLRSVNESSGGNGRMVRHEFVLRVQVINREHALVEAWVEAPPSREQILDRQPMRIVLESDERAVHIDVIDEHAHPPLRIAVLSIPHSPSATTAMYAQCAILRTSGFAAGTHDRPRVLRDAVNAADAATA